ncbi:MAG TPA: tetratricopeptide repeat protein [Phycisphaerae bacterium]|nr:tetratricopeptide repeat protein [Phycisphaerae bacterium]
MGKNIVIGAIIAVCVGALVYFLFQQQSMQRQLQTLQKQSMAASSAPAGPGPAVVINLATQDASAAAHQNAIHTVVTEGYRLLNTRDPAQAEKAIVIFQEGLEKVDPKNTDMLHGLGRALLLVKRYADAADAFKRGLAIDPKKADLASGLGWACYDQQDFPRAREAWENAIANDPKSIDAWSVMSWVYLGMHNRDKAIEGFRVLVDSPQGANRTDWKNGLTMARASNYQLDQIRSQFPLPDPALFNTPPATTKP